MFKGQSSRIPWWLVRFVHLSRREYFADFFITPPLTGLIAALWLLHGATLVSGFVLAGGLVAWTFYEYALHRWLLHEIWLFRDFHALHHDYQRDYIAVHPAVTLLIYGGSWMAFGLQYSSFMVGFSVGYVLYAAAHTICHYAAVSPGNPLFWLRRRHALHHVFHDVNYGVTTSLWDRAFRTEFM